MNSGAAEPLDRDTCVGLLRTVLIGRVAWAAGGGRVEVLPVNFVVDGDSVVFRTAAGGKLAAAGTGGPMSFETDDVEPALRTGWSVLVHGAAEVVTDAASIERLERLPLAPWPQLPRGSSFVRIRMDEITGRLLPLRPGRVTRRRVGPEDDIV